MKQFFLVVSALAIATLHTNAQTKTTTKPKAKPATAAVKPTVAALKNSTDSFSYALGLNVAKNLRQQGIEQITYAAMQKAMDDVFKKKPELLTEQQANSCIQQQLQSNASIRADNQKTISTAFLETNKKRKEVIVLPDGLQYEIIQKGDSASASPKLNDTVVVHYAGRIVEGKEDFDNSYKRGEPITIAVNGVIRGWTEMLQLMHVGEKVKAYIPSELGYGDRGAGAGIPGGAALIFEMELLAIKPAKPAALEAKPTIEADTQKTPN